MSHVVEFRGAMKPVDFARCSANDTELGPCMAWCGHRICLLRSDCVRPTAPAPIKRPLLQRIARRWRIRNARVHLKQLEQHYRALKRGGVAGAAELDGWRRRIGAAWVNLALAERP